MRRHSASALRSFPIPQLVATLLLLASCHPLWAVPRHEKGEIHKQIEALEHRWQQAIVTNDVAEMNRLLADDYIGISSNGIVENKDQALAQRRAGTVRITRLDINDIHVRVYAGGQIAVVTSLANLQGTNGATDIGGRYRYTRVYNLRHGQWQIVSFEASRMHDIDARSKH